MPVGTDPLLEWLRLAKRLCFYDVPYGVEFKDDDLQLVGPKEAKIKSVQIHIFSKPWTSRVQSGSSWESHECAIKDIQG